MGGGGVRTILGKDITDICPSRKYHVCACVYTRINRDKDRNQEYKLEGRGEKGLLQIFKKIEFPTKKVQILLNYLVCELLFLSQWLMP